MITIKRIALLLVIVLLPAAHVFSQVSISISANIAPPPLPVYTQPICPNDGYIWTPGYWAYDNAGGYYWVPGVWVMPPQPGYYWTPGYWGYSGGVYGFYNGYWGTEVGYYGGVNYGYGYGGHGYGGGRWDGGHFRYNTAVSNVNRGAEHYTYSDNSVGSRSPGRTSFNGPGGAAARPNAQEQAAMRAPHVAPTGQQMSHQQTAAKDPQQFAKANGGKPATVAMDKPGGQRMSAAGRPATSPGAPRGGQAHNAAPGNAGQHPAAQPRQQQAQPQQRQQQSRPQPQQQSRPQPQQQNRPQPQQQRPQPQQQAPRGGGAGGHEGGGHEGGEHR